jgi:hypothetical protein
LHVRSIHLPFHPGVLYAAYGKKIHVVLRTWRVAEYNGRERDEEREREKERERKRDVISRLWAYPWGASNKSERDGLTPPSEKEKEPADT